jgi:hypothetical protein
MKLFFSLALFLLTNFLFSQIKTDTIFKTNASKVDVSSSKMKMINDRIDISYLCEDYEKLDLITKKNLILGYGFQGNHIDSLLTEYSILSKSKILFEFDALIYSSYCETYEPITETYVLEFFYSDEAKASNCIGILNKLVEDCEIKEMKSEEMIIGSFNWFFIQNKNRVYFVHRRIPDEEKVPITKILTEKILLLMD